MVNQVVGVKGRLKEKVMEKTGSESNLLLFSFIISNTSKSYYYK